MSTLRYLQSTLSGLQEKKRIAEAKLKIEKQKLKDIEKIIDSINRNFDDYISDIAKNARNTSEGILSGVKGSTNMQNQSDIVRSEDEKQPDSDGQLSAVLSNLRSELSVVQNKIIELEDEIASL